MSSSKTRPSKNLQNGVNNTETKRTELITKINNIVEIINSLNDQKDSIKITYEVNSMIQEIEDYIRRTNEITQSNKVLLEKNKNFIIKLANFLYFASNNYSMDNLDDLKNGELIPELAEKNLYEYVYNTINIINDENTFGNDESIRLNGNIEKLEKEYSKCKASIDKLVKENLANKTEEKDAQITSLTNKLAGQKYAYDELIKEKSALDQKIRFNETNNVNLSKLLESNKKEYIAELEKLNNVIASKNLIIDDLIKTNSSKDKKIQGHDKIIQDTLSEHKQSLQELTNKIEPLKIDISRLTSEKMSFETKLTECMDINKRISTDFSVSIDEKLAPLKNTIKKYRAEYLILYENICRIVNNSRGLSPENELKIEDIKKLSMESLTKLVEVEINNYKSQAKKLIDEHANLANELNNIVKKQYGIQSEKPVEKLIEFNTIVQSFVIELYATYDSKPDLSEPLNEQIKKLKEKVTVDIKENLSKSSRKNNLDDIIEKYGFSKYKDEIEDLLTLLFNKCRDYDLFIQSFKNIVEADFSYLLNKTNKNFNNESMISIIETISSSFKDCKLSSSSLTSKISELEREIKNLNAQLSEKNNNENEINSLNERKDDEIEKIQEELSVKLDLIKLIKKINLKNKHSDNVELINKISDYDDTIHELLYNLYSNNDKYKEKLFEIATDLGIDINNFEGLELLELIVTALVSKYTKLENEIQEDLETLNSNIRNKNTISKEDIALLNKNIRKRNAYIEELENELTNLEDDSNEKNIIIHKIKKEKLKLKEDNRILDKNLDFKEEDKNGLKNYGEHQRSLLLNNIDEIKFLKEHINELKIQQEDDEKIIELLQLKIEEKDKIIEELRIEIDQLNDKIFELESAKSEKSSEILEELRELNETNQRLTNDLEVAGQIYTEQLEYIEELKRDIDAKNVTIEELQEELSKRNESILSLSETIGLLTTELEELKYIKNKLKDNNEQILNSKSQIDISKYNTMKEELELKNIEYADIIEDLKSKLSKYNGLDIDDGDNDVIDSVKDSDFDEEEIVGPNNTDIIENNNRQLKDEMKEMKNAIINLLKLENENYSISELMNMMIDIYNNNLKDNENMLEDCHLQMTSKKNLIEHLKEENNSLVKELENKKNEIQKITKNIKVQNILEKIDDDDESDNNTVYTVNNDDIDDVDDIDDIEDSNVDDNNIDDNINDVEDSNIDDNYVDNIDDVDDIMNNCEEEIERLTNLLNDQINISDELEEELNFYKEESKKLKQKMPKDKIVINKMNESNISVEDFNKLKQHYKKLISDYDKEINNLKNALKKKVSTRDELDNEKEFERSRKRVSENQVIVSKIKLQETVRSLESHKEEVAKYKRMVELQQMNINNLIITIKDMQLTINKINEENQTLRMDIYKKNLEIQEYSRKLKECMETNANNKAIYEDIKRKYDRIDPSSNKDYIDLKQQYESSKTDQLTEIKRLQDMIESIKQDTDVNKYRSMQVNDLINKTDNEIIGNIPINIASNQNLNFQKSLLEPYNPRELSMENLIEGDLDEDYDPSDSESGDDYDEDDNDDDDNDDDDDSDDYDRGKRSKSRVRDFDVDDYDKEKLPTKKKLYISDSESDDDDDDDDDEDSDEEEYYKSNPKSDRYKEYEF